MQSKDMIGVFQDAVRRRQEVIQEHRVPGQRVIGWMCSYVPEEVIYAAGMYPVRVWGGEEPTSHADSYLHVNMCSLVRSTLEQALRGKYDFLDGFITLNTCDNIRRLYDVWSEYQKTHFTHIMSLPHKVTENSIGYFTSEVARLKEGLEAAFDISITHDSLLGAIEVYNKSRSLLRQLDELRKREHPPITGAELLDVVLAGMILPRDRYNNLLEDLVGALEGEKATNGNGGTRLLLVGSELDSSEFLRLIEESGGMVVADDLCTGSHQYWNLTPAGSDPLRALAQRYLERPDCPRMHPSEGRLERIRGMIRDYSVEGVVMAPISFCKLHCEGGVDLSHILKAAEIPYLSITREYNLTSAGQIKTRVESFTDIIKGI